MSSDAAAIAAKKRERVKRKPRQRPPLPPGWQRFILVFCLQLGLFVWCILDFAREPRPQLLLSAVGAAMIMQSYWMIYQAWNSGAPLDPPTYMRRWALGILFALAGALLP